MKPRSCFVHWLVAIGFVASIVVATPLGVKAQSAEPTVPVQEQQVMQQAMESERLRMIADASGKTIAELSAMTDAKLIDITEEYSPTLGYSKITREMPMQTEPDWLSAGLTETVSALSEGIQPFTLPAATMYLPYVNTGSAYVPPPPPPTPTPEVPTLPITVQQLKEREAAAVVTGKELIPPHADQIPENLCSSETAGAPVWIIDNTDGKIYIVGHNDGNGLFFTTLSNEVIGTESEHYEVTFFNGLKLWVDRFYRDGKTKYQVTIREYTGSHNLTLKFGQYLVLQDVKSKGFPYTAELILDATQFVPTARTPMRHACEMLTMFATQEGNNNVAFNAAFTLKQAGFQTGAVYGSMWEQIPPYRDFLFSKDAYRNCFIGIRGTQTPPQFWGINGAGFPMVQYESKVCISPELYILASQSDPLGLVLYALVVINETGNPDTEIEWPGPTPGKTTPRLILRYVEKTFWIGYGIRKLTGPDDVASGIRTFVFGEAEVILCYDYKDMASCDFVVQLATVISEIQIGMPPFQKYQFNTQTYGMLSRPYAQGAPFMLWRKANVAVASADQFTFYLPDPSTIEQILSDCCGMTPEILGVISFNAETTYTYIQFLRTWISRLDPAYTEETPWIPSNGTIQPNPEQDWIGVPTIVTVKQVLLDTRADRVCILVKGVESCIDHVNVINPSVPDITVWPGYGIKTVGSKLDLVWTDYGDAVPEDSPTNCPLNQSGTLCAFPVRPYPYTMILASTLRSIAAAQGCVDVTVTRRMGNGTEIVYPGTDFQILEGVGYKMTSSTECSLNFNQ